MRRHGVSAFGVLLVFLGVPYAGGFALLFLLSDKLPPAEDPYPPLMARWYESKGHDRSHDEAKEIFGEFVAKSFPIGSDAEGAIAEISGGGFEVATSGADSVELVWKRHVTFCSEWYSIGIQKDAGGRVAEISSGLQPICP
jgi:hypothetical protein